MALGDIANSIFGNPYSDAAAQQRPYLAGLMALGQQNVQGYGGQAAGAITSGVQGATGAIQGGANTATGAITGNLDPALAALRSGTYGGATALTGAVDPAIAALTGGVAGVRGDYNPLLTAANSYYGSTGQASQAQADALGLNGPEGVARAQGAFQTGPGFQFALKTGTDALTRAQNAAGMGASGNTARAAEEFGVGFGQQEWQKYLANLQGIQNLYAPLALSGYGQYGQGTGQAALTAGTGAANIYTGTGQRLSDLLSQSGVQQAGAYTGAGRSLADIAQQAGLAQGNIYNQGGVNTANILQNTGQQLNATNLAYGIPYASTYGAEAAQNAANTQGLINLGLNAAKLYAGIPPTGTVGSTTGARYG